MNAEPFTPALERPSFAPRYWTGWLMVAFVWLLGNLPRWMGRTLVAPLGPLMFHVLKSRRRIAERNLAVCLPELSKEEQHEILRGCFRSLARMLAEMSWCWAGPKQDLASISEIRGYENIDAARRKGCGILLVTGHVTCLEIGARLLGERFGGKGMYRPLNNPVMEWYQNRGRSHYASGMIAKRDFRAAIRHLKAGGYLWYAPDQDFGPKSSLFTPFFKVSTATLLATHRLPKMTGCCVLTMLPRYDETLKKYVVEISPMLENFPSDDPLQDLTRINARIEEQVRLAPSQYWWVHRRFKTRPPGEADFYGADSRDRKGTT